LNRQKNAYRTVVVKPLGKCPLRRTKRRRENNNIKMDVREEGGDSWRTWNLWAHLMTIT
jgi:hypothetical protein